MLLALHELLELGGRILVADLFEFLERHGEFGVLRLLLVFLVLLAADLLGAGRRLRLRLGLLILLVLHVTEGVLVLLLLLLFLLLLLVLFLLIGFLLILFLFLILLLLVVFLLILFLLVLVLVFLILLGRFFLFEQILKFLAQARPFGRFGIELFPEIDGLQCVADDLLGRVLLGGLDPLAVRDGGLSQLGAILRGQGRGFGQPRHGGGKRFGESIARRVRAAH